MIAPALRCTRTDPHSCELGRHADRPCTVPGHDHARIPDPVPGWRDLGAYLAGKGPRLEPDPRPFIHCPVCHGWHGADVSHR